MSAVAERTRTRVVLADGCAGGYCLKMAGELHAQLSDGRYRWPMSTLTLDGWEPRRTARKRAAHAERLGYSFRQIDRQHHEAAVFAINTSKPERQGRPMSDSYLQPHRFGPNPLVCDRHHVYTYGVFADPELVAYLWLYRVGELALVSSILGHGDHERNDVMYLLAVRALEHQAPLGGTAVYNRHDSGTDGLRYFKERLGFTATEAEWLL